MPGTIHWATRERWEFYFLLIILVMSWPALVGGLIVINSIEIVWLSAGFLVALAAFCLES